MKNIQASTKQNVQNIW